MSWSEGELLAFDLETTGVDPATAVPVSYAFSRLSRDRSAIRVASLVDPGVPIPAGATAVHGITTERARSEGVELAAAAGLVLDEIVAAGREGVPVVGMNLRYDLAIVDRIGRELRGEGLRELGWSGPALDVLVIDRHLDRWRRGRRTLGDLCAHYGVELEAAHDACADAEAAAGVLWELCRRWPELGALAIDELHAEQVRWHRSWGEDYSDWCRKKGRPGLDPAELEWPLISGTPDP